MGYFESVDHVFTQWYFNGVGSSFIAYSYLISDSWERWSVFSFKGVNFIDKLSIVEIVFIYLYAQKRFVLDCLLGHTQPIGTQYAWMFMDEHLTNSYFMSQVAAMLTACWSKNNQGIWQTHRQQFSCTFCHQFICYLHISLSYCFYWHILVMFIDGLGEFAESLAGWLDVQPFIFVFAEYFREVGLIQSAQHQIGISQSQFLSYSIAGWSRVGTYAFRSNHKHAIVECQFGSTSSSNCVDLKMGSAKLYPLHFKIIPGGEHFLLYSWYFSGGSSHIQADQIWVRNCVLLMGHFDIF